jgi:uncharacterized repeat protein (TIGR01451 family)
MNQRAITGFGLALLCAAGLHVAELKAASVNVTFTFTRVVELQCDEGIGESCPNDYYPKVDIDAQGLDDGKSRFCCAHGTDFQPNWVFTRVVDTSHSPFSIHVELWDQDDLSGDDQIDIANGPNSLDIVVNPKNCTWTGGGLTGVLNTQSSSQGSGSDSAKIYFVINVPNVSCQDSDGDGLLDVWETNGFDADGDGIIDVNLPAMGANPLRADLFLELDYLVAFTHTHAPLQGAIQQVVQAFATAPLGNPDGTTGIQLHVDVGPIYGVGVVTQVPGARGAIGTFGDFGGGNQIAEAGNAIVDWDGPAGNTAANFFSIKNFNPNRSAIFRYGIFVHQTNLRAAANDCTSGWAKGIPGANFLVSLGGTGSAGGPCWGPDLNGFSIGNQNQQAGTLMHEFGHTLGLQHGGGDSTNNKPNYLSVMNYTFQPCSVTAAGVLSPGACDYSRVKLLSLNENSLDECQGADNGALGLGAVDWNADGKTEGAGSCQAPNNANVSANINADFNDANNNNQQDPGEAPIFSTLDGFQDWKAIVFNHRTLFDFGTAGEPTDQEPNPEDIARARERMSQQLRPGLFVDQTGPADAGPGDTLTYGVRVENTLAHAGRGPALSVSVVDTKPDSTTQTLAIGNMPLGTVTNRTTSYLVPCTTSDGAILTSSAQATGQDYVGNAVASADSVLTTIHAPVFTMSLTATSAVNAGEAISYTISYRNTGSGAATNVVITETVPAGVYYSIALDRGTGPKPTLVTVNPDGTTTLVWNVGGVPATSAPASINFTARPTLLALGGTTFTDGVSLTFQSGSGCAAPPVRASAATLITVVGLKPEHEPERRTHWREHARDESPEIFARLQATDQRFDGRDGTAPDGALTAAEADAVLAQGSIFSFFRRTSVNRLEQELLALYFNLATRRLNADTGLRSDDAGALGLTNVRGAALHTHTTLALPFGEPTEKQYRAAIELLDETNERR